MTSTPLPSHPSTSAPSHATRAMMLVAWLSAAIFSAYIVIFYGGAIFTGTMHEDWNEVLPRLYDQASLPANIMIGLHFFAGAAVLMLGPLQLLPSKRQRAPGLHLAYDFLFH